MANWPPPMGKPQDHQTKIKNDFPIGFFTFLLLLPREIVLEWERTVANEEHFFLPTVRSEYACIRVVMVTRKMSHMSHMFVSTQLLNELS